MGSSQQSARTADDHTHRLSEELRVAEYNSVRDEWLASRHAQQHTLQWTLAALAVLLAGILNSKARDNQPFLYVALSAATGTIAICSQAIWFGELMRMERAALFLRGLETAVHRELPSAAGVLPPLMWETWRGVEHRGKDDPWVPKAAPSVIAGFGLYGLVAFAAVVLLAAASTDDKIPASDQRVALAGALVVAVLYAVVTGVVLVMAWRIFRTSDQGAALEKVFPEDGVEATDRDGP